MSEAHDAAIARLDDYLRNAGGDAQVEDYELDLFTRALEGAAPELEFRSQLGSTLRAMNARGTLDIWLTAQGVERLLKSGRKVLQFELDIHAPVVPDLSSDFEILVTKVPIKLDGIRRLEAEVCSLSGELLKRMPDIAFDPADGAVFVCCEAELARASANTPTITRVYAFDDDGRRLLCELPGS
jgi:hypothetical protein